jgi:membrane protein YdbS with pleckstrin-like domain
VLIVLVLGISGTLIWFSSLETLTIANAIVIPVMIVMTFLVLPPYWRLPKKCKKELEQSKMGIHE